MSVDDIRFRPADALMGHYMYDFGLGKVTSITDENNNTQCFQYDDLGRLTKAFETNSDVAAIKAYDYHNVRGCTVTVFT